MPKTLGRHGGLLALLTRFLALIAVALLVTMSLLGCGGSSRAPANTQTAAEGPPPIAHANIVPDVVGALKSYNPAVARHNRGAAVADRLFYAKDYLRVRGFAADVTLQPAAGEDTQQPPPGTAVGPDAVIHVQIMTIAAR